MLEEIKNYFFSHKDTTNSSQIPRQGDCESFQQRINALAASIWQWGCQLIERVFPEKISPIKVHLINSKSGISPQISIFGKKIIEKGKSFTGSLSWFSPPFGTFGLQSSYGRFCSQETEGDYIYSLICWELYGFLLLKSDELKTPELHNKLNHQVYIWGKSPSNMNEETTLNAGDLIFMDESNHIVIATGNGQEVLSIWNRPKDGLCLTTIQELMEIWPVEQKPALCRISVTEIYTFLQKIKKEI